MSAGFPFVLLHADLVRTGLELPWGSHSVVIASILNALDQGSRDGAGISLGSEHLVSIAEAARSLLVNVGAELVDARALLPSRIRAQVRRRGPAVFLARLIR